MKNKLRECIYFLSLVAFSLFVSLGTSWAAEPQIAAGQTHTVALKSNGTLWAWGYNANGQLGDGTTFERDTPVQVSGGGNNWVAVSAGRLHTVALKSNGTLWVWGYNAYGQLGDNSNTDRHTPVEVFGGGNTWVAIAAGADHTVALKSDGTLWTWGYNFFGQLGDNSTTNRNTPVQVFGGGNTWVAIAGGGNHTVALKSDGTLWAWGINDRGQLGDGTNTLRNTPVQVFGGGNTWVAIAARFNHTVALKSDGTLWTWGSNFYGQLGDATNTDRNAPVQTSGGGNIWVAIAAGDNHTVALKSDGTLWTWGYNFYGQLGDSSNTNRNTPVEVSGGETTWVAIAAGYVHTVAMKSDGTFLAWGYNQNGQLGDGTNIHRNTPVQVFGAGNTWVAIAAGYAHTVALKSDGTLWVWGRNDFGQLGDGTNTQRNTPVQVSGGGNTWVAIAAGWYHTVALKSDGSLWAWGYNANGQLGDGTNTDSNTPVQVFAKNTQWVAIAAGGNHTVALKSGGSLWAWGRNDFGQLGDGTFTDSNMPVQVSGGGNTWVAIAAGWYHTVALKSDGTLWAWGYNGAGQLGDGTTFQKNTPVQVFGGGSTWVAIATGGLHTVALKSNGTLWAWGYNDLGQLGDSSNTSRNTPVQVFGGGSTWVTVAAGSVHTVALKSDGTLWAWGANYDGQIGDGTNNQRSVPIPVSPGGNAFVAIAVAAGASHTVALKSDGTLWAWGDNGDGQLGDGTFTSKNLPIRIGPRWIVDFDGDGSSDLAGLTSNGLIFYTTNRSTWTQIPGALNQLVVGDFNGDDLSDLAGLTSNGLIFYTTNRSTWTQIPGVLNQLVVGDFDGDGTSDLAGLTSNGLIFYTTDRSTWAQIPGVLDQLVVGDFDGDGSSDLAGLTSNGLIFYTTNRSTWTQIPGVLEQLVE